MLSYFQVPVLTRSTSRCTPWKGSAGGTRTGWELLLLVEVQIHQHTLGYSGKPPTSSAWVSWGRSFTPTSRRPENTQVINKCKYGFSCEVKRCSSLQILKKHKTSVCFLTRHFFGHGVGPAQWPDANCYMECLIIHLCEAFPTHKRGKGNVTLRWNLVQGCYTS